VKFFKTPIFRQRDYTKRCKYLNRLHLDKFKSIVMSSLAFDECIFGLERPMVNPGRWIGSLSAIRCWEATLTGLDSMHVSWDHVHFIDSKEWQSHLLPGVEGTDNLKLASKELGIACYPQYEKLITKHGDADGILIAKWLKETNKCLSNKNVKKR